MRREQETKDIAAQKAARRERRAKLLNDVPVRMSSSAGIAKQQHSQPAISGLNNQLLSVRGWSGFLGNVGRVTPPADSATSLDAFRSRSPQWPSCSQDRAPKLLAC